MTRWHLSVKTAAALAFLAVAALPVWLAWEFPQTVAIELEEKQARNFHAAYTDAAILSLERYHIDVKTGFGMLADDLEPPRPSPERDRMMAMKALGFYHICVFDVVTGALLGASELDGMPCPERVDETRLEAIRSMAVGGQVRISRVSLDEAGRPVLYVMRRSGAAITVGSLGTEYFRELADAITFGKNGHAAILDYTGRVIAHPNDDWVMSTRSMAGIDIVQRLMAGQSGATSFDSPAREEEMFTSFGSVKGPGWGILVNQPQSEMELIVHEIKDGTVKVLVIALAIAAMLAMLAAHLLLDPIRRIRMAAERLGNGDGVALIPPMGAGSRLTEINDLRAAFNAMVLRIRRSRRTEVAARREAQEATRIKSRFLANMSHELRTPLNAIIGFAEVTQRRLAGKDRERDVEYLGYIHDSGLHLLSIINDLLDLSRIEAGVWHLDEEDVDVSLAIRDSRTMLGTMPEEKNISIVLRGVDEAVMLWADRRAIRQILLNLTTNAVRYTQEGGQVIVTCAIGEGGAVTLLVEDNGPGIDADELSKIRAPFSRGRAHETAAIPGTGLGLSIVDALAELHGARFDLLSEPGRGTCAKIVFPSSRTLLTLVNGSESALRAAQ